MKSRPARRRTTEELVRVFAEEVNAQDQCIMQGDHRPIAASEVGLPSLEAEMTLKRYERGELEIK